MRWLRYVIYSLLAIVLLASAALGWLALEVRSGLEIPDAPDTGAGVLAWAEAPPGFSQGHAAPVLPMPKFSGLASTPMEARPWTRWWWPGGDVEASDACEQLEQLRQRGFGGVEIQPFNAGLQALRDAGARARINDFDSPDWFRTLGEVMNCAGRLGMAVYLNHLSGWPAGGPQVGLRDGLWTLRYAEVFVDGGEQGGRDERIALPVPEPGINDYLMSLAEVAIDMELAGFAVDHRELLALVAARVSGGERASSPLDATDTLELDSKSVQVLTDQVVDGALTWRVPPGRWVLIAAYRMPSAEAPTLVAAEDPGYVIDHLDAGRLRAHYDYAYGARTGLSAHYGKAFQGFFNDSLEFKLDRLAAKDILPAFAERRGYDLAPHLPAVFVDAYDNFFIRDVGRTRSAPAFRLDDTDERVRYDYQLTLSDLVIERFAETSAAWAGERDLWSRAQTYGFEMDTLRALGANHIPETEHLWGSSSEYVMKLAGSAALLYGRPLVSAESFVWAKRAYAVTPRHIKAGADLLFLSGVNQVVYHGVPYSKASPAYAEVYGELGWYPFLGPGNPSGFAGNYGPVSPVWDALPQLNEYIARSQQLLQSGRPVVDVLVYYPFLGFPKSVEDSELVTEDFLSAGLFPGEPAVAGELALDLPLVKFLPEEKDPRLDWLERLIPTLKAMNAAGITWGWVNSHALETGRASDVGASAVLVADVDAMPVATVAALASLSPGGPSPLFLGALPQRQPGLHDYVAADEQVSRQVRRLAEGRTLSEAGELVSRVRPFVAISGDLAVRRTSRVDAAGNSVHLLVNRSLQPVSATLAPADAFSNKRAYWFDAASGATWPARQTSRGGFELSLGPLEARFLLIGEEVVHDHRKPLSVVLASNAPGAGEPVTGEWIVSVAGQQSRLTQPFQLFHALPQGGGEPVELLYETVFELPARKAGAVVLDLGEVAGVAHVQVNGVDLPPLSFDPFLMDVSGVVRAGSNQLRVRVVPPLRNSLVTSDEPEHESFRQFRDQLGGVGLRGPVVVHGLPVSEGLDGLAETQEKTESE